MRQHFDKKQLDPFGFRLNHHIRGGDAVIVPLHIKACKKSPCSCGAVDAMPKGVLNCEVEWPVWNPKRYT